MAPERLDSAELLFEVSATAPSELEDDSPVEVPSMPAGTSHKNDLPAESSMMSSIISNNPTPLLDEGSTALPAASPRLPKDFLKKLTNHGAAYLVDDGDTFSITWLSCNKPNSPDTHPGVHLKITTTEIATPRPITIREELLDASHIMVYDDDTSKSLSFFLDPRNEEMEYDSWLWLKSELDDFFETPAYQITKTTLWSTYNHCHHAHDADKLPGWALTIAFNYRNDLGCRVVYYPPSVRDLNGFWDFPSLDGKRDMKDLVTPEIVKEAVTTFESPFYFGPPLAKGVFKPCQ
jgi:hypothetical protein